MSDLGDLSKLTVKVLQKELEDRGLEKKGRKAELVERLTEALAGGASGNAAEGDAAPAAAAEEAPADDNSVKEEPAAAAEEPAAAADDTADAAGAAAEPASTKADRSPSQDRDDDRPRRSRSRSPVARGRDSSRSRSQGTGGSGDGDGGDDRVPNLTDYKGGERQSGFLGEVRDDSGADMCRDYLRGRCSRPSGCRYSHGNGSIKQDPTPDGGYKKDGGGGGSEVRRGERRRETTEKKCVRVCGGSSLCVCVRACTTTALT